MTSEHEQSIRCETCGYNLHGLVEPRCPECGVHFDRDALVNEFRVPGMRAWQYIRVLLIAPALTLIAVLSLPIASGAGSVLFAVFSCSTPLVVVVVAGALAADPRLYTRSQREVRDARTFGSHVMQFFYAAVLQICLILIVVGLFLVFGHGRL
jgi:hypothetical protein